MLRICVEQVWSTTRNTATSLFYKTWAQTCIFQTNVVLYTYTLIWLFYTKGQNIQNSKAEFNRNHQLQISSHYRASSEQTIRAHGYDNLSSSLDYWHFHSFKIKLYSISKTKSSSYEQISLADWELVHGVV